MIECSESSEEQSEFPVSVPSIWLRSGHWTGYWLQGGRYDFQMEITVAGETVRGRGTDIAGNFAIVGHTSVLGRGLQFVKLTPASFGPITYTGQWQEDNG